MVLLTTYLDPCILPATQERALRRAGKHLLFTEEAAMKPFAPTSAHFGSLQSRHIFSPGYGHYMRCCVCPFRREASPARPRAGSPGVAQRDDPGSQRSCDSGRYGNTEQPGKRVQPRIYFGRQRTLHIFAGSRRDLQLESGSHGIPDLRAEWNSADRRSDRNSGCNPHGRPSHPNGGGSRYGSGLKHRQCQCGYGHLRAASC